MKRGDKLRDLEGTKKISGTGRPHGRGGGEVFLVGGILNSRKIRINSGKKAPSVEEEKGTNMKSWD